MEADVVFPTQVAQTKLMVQDNDKWISRVLIAYLPVLKNSKITKNKIVYPPPKPPPPLLVLVLSISLWPDFLFSKY
jgi:hypothetical protein